MEFKLASGAVLNVTMSSFDDADALQTALLNAAKGMKLNADIESQDVSDMLGPILNAATSKEVKAAMFKCFERVTYNGQRMGKELLDDPEIGERVREDLYEIQINVAKVNCGPFIKRAFSLFKGFRKELTAGTPEQK